MSNHKTKHNIQRVHNCNIFITTERFEKPSLELRTKLTCLQTRVFESFQMHTTFCLNTSEEKVSTLMESPVTLRISWTRGTAAASPHRCNSLAASPNNARVNEKPLVLHPIIWTKLMAYTINNSRIQETVTSKTG